MMVEFDCEELVKSIKKKRGCLWGISSILDDINGAEQGLRAYVLLDLDVITAQLRTRS